MDAAQSGDALPASTLSPLCRFMVEVFCFQPQCHVLVSHMSHFCQGLCGAGRGAAACNAGRFNYVG